MSNRMRTIVLCAAMLFWYPSEGQSFYFGADLSYVNEMEDCGVVYKESGVEKDVHEIFADHGCNLVRLRLWHTPSWYDGLNSGNRYSDLADVRIAIERAHAQGMKVLLDFHLSDNWADPGKQVVPAAWAPVVDDLPALKDSLYNYVHAVLSVLSDDGLLPEMVQIGNETNRGILLSQAVNDQGWSLDWNRNSQLFNVAIDAVHAVEQETGKEIGVVIHVADPKTAAWLFDQFIDNGVTGFDIMGISYYWQWHQPTTIAQTGDIILTLRNNHPDYDVMIVETGYIWTTQSNDAANNVLNTTNPAYSPASPDNQRLWLVDLTQEVINSGGKGVIYWEPAWVSSTCWTQWGHGSHGENAAFFDFNNNLMQNGGIAWMTYPYENLSAIEESRAVAGFDVTIDTNSHRLNIAVGAARGYKNLNVRLANAVGQVVLAVGFDPGQTEGVQSIPIPALQPGVYFVVISNDTGTILTRKVWIGGNE